MLFSGANLDSNSTSGEKHNHHGDCFLFAEFSEMQITQKLHWKGICQTFPPNKKNVGWTVGTVGIPIRKKSMFVYVCKTIFVFQPT